MIMYLENDEIRMRALEPEDLDILYKWENDSEEWIYGNTLSPYSKLTLRKYISQTQEQDIYEAKQLRLIVELKSDKTVVGTIDLYDFDFHHSRAGVGILIDKNYRNRKYATQILALIKEYVFNFLKINQIYAYIGEENKKSIGLFEKAGYIRSGILLEWVCLHSEFKNVYIYQLIKDKNS